MHYTAESTKQDRQVASEIYKGLLVDMPFSNASAVLKANGHPMPIRLGGNCYDQVNELIHRGGANSMITDQKGSLHVAALSTDDNFFYDPSFGVGPLKVESQSRKSRAGVLFSYSRKDNFFGVDRVGGKNSYRYNLKQSANSPDALGYAVITAATVGDELVFTAYDDRANDPISLWLLEQGFAVTRSGQIALAHSKTFDSSIRELGSRVGESAASLKELMQEASHENSKLDAIRQEVLRESSAQ